LPTPPRCKSVPSTGSGHTDRTSALKSASVRPSRRTSAVAFTGDSPEPDDPLLCFAPYLHGAPRRNSITPDRQRAFIAALAATGTVTQAARSIGASLEALYKLRHRPGAEQFSAAWDLAIERGIGRLEDCALELAIAGEELPIVSAGKLLGTYRKHNFGHIRFVLSQRRAARWSAQGADYAALKPGHPVYDRLHAEWAKDAYGDEQEVYDSIDAMIDEMRERTLAADRLLEGPDTDGRADGDDDLK
jgi:hypothetical protein